MEKQSTEKPSTDIQTRQKQTKPSANSDAPKDKVDLFPIFKTLYKLILDFDHAHRQFPKVHKFTVGSRISNSLMLTLEQVISAIVLPLDRESCLSRVIVELEKIRILIRISHDLKAIDNKRYEKFSRLVVRVLQQASALLKAAKKQSGK